MNNEQQPNPPWRVFANVWGDTPRWWEWDAEEHEFYEVERVGAHMKAKMLMVIEHSDNHPEAVAIIAAARAEGDEL